VNAFNIKSSEKESCFESRRSSSRFAPGLRRSHGQLIVMVILLIAVLGLMLFLRRAGSGKPPPAPDVPVAMENLTYYNRFYNFSVEAPSNDWEISHNQVVDSLRRENPFVSVFENINPIMEMRRRDGDSTIAVVKVGVIDFAQPRTPRGLAMQNLEEIRRELSAEGDTVRMIQAVTPITGRILQGAYFMVEVPQGKKPAPRPTPKGRLPVWIIAFFVRNQLGHSIVCQTTKEDYVFLRDDFATIIESFRYLQ
jgi:hypothetical protein